MKKYTCLQPVTLGNMQLKNRLVLPPMVVNYATAKTGAVTDQYIDYLEERAKGGVGLIVMEATSVHPSGRGFLRGACIDSDYLIPQLRKLTERVHAYGAKIAIQLHHAGRETSAKVTGQPLLAPSECPVAYSDEKVRALSQAELNLLADAYAQGARRAKEAGFDAVQIHGAHGYLLTEFTSPYTNKRDDAYGGSWEKRLRFPLEVIRKVREAVGQDFTVTYRMTVDEGLEDGLTLEDSCRMAPVLARSGIDALHVVAGNYASGHLVIPVQASPMCSNEARVEAIRKAIAGAIPVVVAGRIKTIEDAERLIQEGKTDFVAMGRALLCEPFLPIKAANGDELVRPCISCKEACEAHVGQGLEVGCILNPRLGEEGVFPLQTKAAKPCKVMVIGAGPAGLEAACTAAERGHQVDLYEQSGRIGGMLNQAAVPPFKSELYKITAYYDARLARAGVQLHLNSPVDEALVAAQKPDALIVAVGAQAFIPAIAGAQTMPACTALELLDGKAAVGKNMVVLGGGQVGVECAEFLAAQGCKVTVLEMLSTIAPTMEGTARSLMMERFHAYGICLRPDVSVTRMEAGKLYLKSCDREEVLEGVDGIVWATGYKADPGLRARFLESAPRVEFVGDCLLPANIEHAVNAAFHAAWAL